jgi:hypothetical protein
MIERQISLPIVGLIAGTRVALGAGLGLLLADRFTSERREACGWTLLAVGAITTIPLALEVLTANCVTEHGETGMGAQVRHQAGDRMPSHA